LSACVYAGTDELQSQWRVERRFEPTLPRDRAEELMARWDRAVRQATAE
jgi:glycerol kinase